MCCWRFLYHLIFFDRYLVIIVFASDWLTTIKISLYIYIYMNPPFGLFYSIRLYFFFYLTDFHFFRNRITLQRSKSGRLYCYYKQVKQNNIYISHIQLVLILVSAACRELLIRVYCSIFSCAVVNKTTIYILFSTINSLFPYSSLYSTTKWHRLAAQRYYYCNIFHSLWLMYDYYDVLLSGMMTRRYDSKLKKN